MAEEKITKPTKPMSQKEFLAEAAKIHNEWAKTARVIVDPRYSNNSPSQYTEGIEAVSAIWEDEKVYQERIHELMDRYYTSNGKPTRAERIQAAKDAVAADRAAGKLPPSRKKEEDEGKEAGTS